MECISYELIDAVWPEHDRTSCSDENPCNAYGEGDEYGHPRCSRCFALDNIGQPLCDFQVDATIRRKMSPEVIRERALKKLTPLERQTLGLDK